MESPLTKRSAPEQDHLNKSKQVGCLCEKSKCLKMYCACFSKGGYCGEHCQCKTCCNVSGNKVTSL